MPPLVSAMESKNDQVAMLDARLRALRSAPDVLTLEARRLEKEAKARLKTFRARLNGHPDDAREPARRRPRLLRWRCETRPSTRAGNAP
jgi:hypothetical protein